MDKWKKIVFSGKKIITAKNWDKLTDKEKGFFERRVESGITVQALFNVFFFLNPYMYQQDGPDHLQWKTYQWLRSMDAD